MAVKQQTIQWKVKRLREALDAIECSRYSMLSIESICSQIDWLWRFRYISAAEKDELCDRAVAVMDAGLCR